VGSRVRVVAVLGAGLLPGLLGACYTYHPLLTHPEPTSRVALVLNDAGRVAAAPQIGPQAARVEGDVISATDTGYVLSVSGVKPIEGDWVKWTGETVSVRRDAVASLYERRLSRGRTVAMVAGLTIALFAAASKLDLFGLGFDPPDDTGGGGDPTDQ
jgi:hypothetical protein